MPPIQFIPPIVPEQSGKIAVESSIEDISIMRAIKNTQNVAIEINEGTLMLTDGQKIEFADKLAK